MNTLNEQQEQWMGVEAAAAMVGAEVAWQQQQPLPALYQPQPQPQTQQPQQHLPLFFQPQPQPQLQPQYYYQPQPQPQQMVPLSILQPLLAQLDHYRLMFEAKPAENAPRYSPGRSSKGNSTDDEDHIEDAGDDEDNSGDDNHNAPKGAKPTGSFRRRTQRPEPMTAEESEGRCRAAFNKAVETLWREDENAEDLRTRFATYVLDTLGFHHVQESKSHAYMATKVKPEGAEGTPDEPLQDMFESIFEICSINIVNDKPVFRYKIRNAEFRKVYLHGYQRKGNKKINYRTE